MPVLLVSGKNSLHYKQTPPLFVLLGWSAPTIEYPFIYCFSLSSGIAKSKTVSDKQVMPMFLINKCFC